MKAPDFLENIVDSDHIIIALTSLNVEGDKDGYFNFYSLLKSKSFSTLLIKDMGNQWYTGGINGLGHNLEEVIHSLKEKIIGYKFVSVIGSSMGGYGAILYGALLGATKVVAFSPRTSISMQKNNVFHGERSADFLSRVSAPKNHYPKINVSGDDLLSLRSLLKKYPVFVNVYVSQNDSLDMLHADDISDIAYVSIDRIPGFCHLIGYELQEIGVMPRIIDFLVIPNIIFNVSNVINSHKSLFTVLCENTKIKCKSATSISITINTRLPEKLADILFDEKTSLDLLVKPEYGLGQYQHKIKINRSSFNKGNLEFEMTILKNGLFQGLNEVYIELDSSMNIHSSIRVNSFYIGSFVADNHCLENDESIDLTNLMHSDFVAPNLFDDGFKTVIWGPYITLPMGSYLASMRIYGITSEIDIAIDVCYEEGPIILCKRYSRCHNDGIIVNLPFFLGRSTENIEFRVHIFSDQENISALEFSSKLHSINPKSYLPPTLHHEAFLFPSSHETDV